MEMKLKLGLLTKDITLYKSYVFSSRIRTLVAMATNSFHRVIMGKVEIDNFRLVILEFFILLQKCLLRNSPCFIRLLAKSLYLID